jgi:hypothetical protein
MNFLELSKNDLKKKSFVENKFTDMFAKSWFIFKFIFKDASDFVFLCVIEQFNISDLKCTSTLLIITLAC